MKRGLDALVLSGGGLYGAAQAGMIAELVEHTGWTPDIICGTSAGALNGVWMAAGWDPTRASDLEQIWLSLAPNGPFPQRRHRQLWSILTLRPSLQNGAALRALIERCTPVVDLAELDVPTHVSGCDLVTGETVWFNSGDAREALYASAALPGLVPPTRIDDRWLIDGGVVANVPVARAVALGATRVVCLDVSAADVATTNLPRTALGMLLRSFALARHSAAREQLEVFANSIELCHVRCVEPSDGQRADWSRVSALCDAGRTTMRTALEHDAALAQVLTAPVSAPVAVPAGTASWWRQLRSRRGSRNAALTAATS